MEPVDVRKRLRSLSPDGGASAAFASVKEMLDIIQREPDLATVNRTTFYRWVDADGPPPPPRAERALAVLERHLASRKRLVIAVPLNFWCLPLLRLAKCSTSGEPVKRRRYEIRHVTPEGTLEAEVRLTDTGNEAADLLNEEAADVAFSALKWLQKEEGRASRIVRVCRAPLKGIIRSKSSSTDNSFSLEQLAGQRVGQPEGTVTLSEMETSAITFEKVDLSPRHPERIKRALETQDHKKGVVAFVAWDPIVSNVWKELGGKPDSRPESEPKFVEVSSGVLGYLETHIGVRMGVFEDSPSAANSFRLLLSSLKATSQAVVELQKELGRPGKSVKPIADFGLDESLANRLLPPIEGKEAYSPADADIRSAWSQALRGCIFGLADYEVNEILKIWDYSSRSR